MTLSDAFFDQLRSLHKNVSETYEHLNRLQSELDREVSAVHHDIERDSFDLFGGHTHAKRLQDILRKRRVIKGEFIRIQPIYNMLAQNFEKVKSSYTRKTAANDKVRSMQNVTLTIDDIGGLIHANDNR